MNYQKIDDWLGAQSINLKTALERLWWSLVYVTDAYVELFNHVQLALFGKRNQWVSRLVALATIVGPLVLLVIL